MAAPAQAQAEIDARNAAFWDELCGSGLAKQLGITESSPESLKRFDQAYMDIYPYLPGYLPAPEGDRRDLLEIGLGYGTVGQILAERGFRYRGLDLAQGPVSMMEYRLAQVGAEGSEARQGSVLELPYEDASFDHVVSIGCIHHTGDIPKGISEVKRVLRPGGRAMVMLYNRHSWRLLRTRLVQRLDRLRGRSTDEEDTRGLFDKSTAGEVAPMTEFVSRSQVRGLFSDCAEVRIDVQNFDPVVAPRHLFVIPRERFLGNIARVLGLDLYITATK
jgi:SAM-dependent methyltransferase